MFSASLLTLITSLSTALAARGAFLEQVGNSTWVIGNNLWNLTQGPVYGTKLYYQGYDAVGTAVGHYVGVDGENNFQFTSASIVSEGDDYIDVAFSATQGDFHWVIYDDLAGAYQYFVNRALPDLSILRSLWRLDPQRFLNGRTYLKDEPLPDYSLYANATKVQDETWQLANGTFITKYDFSTPVRGRDFNGVYGPNTGSWYIHPSYEYYSGNHLAQTLTVHRESATGDAVQLNVVQDTSHFQIGVKTTQPVGKTWGPWLWYLNDGSKDDAAARTQQEKASFPYSFLNDTAYQTRGSLTGRLTLSDGRPASGAAIYIGDVDTTIRPLAQGVGYRYTTYASEDGSFELKDVRTGSYGLYAWSNGGEIGDVYTNFTQTPVVVSAEEETALGSLDWTVPSNKQIFQVGEFSKNATGFKNSGPYRHGLAEKSPSNFTFIVGESKTEDWYYAQSNLGTWSIAFDIPEVTNRTALLTVSLAGYSQSTSLVISANGNNLGSLNKDTLASDPAVYRSGTVSGEWRLFQYEIAPGLLKTGRNSIDFTVDRYVLWRGFLWDSIILEWQS
ncbi:rhamnogalacturonate lyase B-like protein 1 [Elsinoe australis]|uniref:rhamnogalacturonan endolyase n=1 Tax=Elsinoe australis TaxID=40998 RepID=A0A4U7B687_9PEZI|nr:rhamnogalacturonate lyase B-like protein 1 [Elsinoe australis]